VYKILRLELQSFKRYLVSGGGHERNRHAKAINSEFTPALDSDEDSVLYSVALRMCYHKSPMMLFG